MIVNLVITVFLCCFDQFQVSTRFRDIVDNTPELQYNLEVQAAGYRKSRIIPDNNLSILEKLEDFRKTQRIWRNPKLQQLPQWTAPVAFDYFDVFDSVVIGREPGSNALLVIRLEAEPCLERLPFEEPLYVRGADVTQDLLVVVSVDEMELRCMRFLSLSNGRKHPRARKYSVDETFLGSASSMNHTMDVFARVHIWNDWLTFEVGTTPSEMSFYLCHWPSGRVCMASQQ